MISNDLDMPNLRDLAYLGYLRSACVVYKRGTEGELTWTYWP